MTEQPDRPRASVAPLAKLPVFYDLAGKRVVLAGAGHGAAWKGELLAASGAHVEIFAAEPGEDLSRLVETPLAAGSITLRHREWEEVDLAGAAMAVGDFEAEEDAARFAAAARSLGVPVNLIDNPRFCDFQFGAIVNRSPVVVAISSDGAAPILATAIRRRIEAMLPIALADWAAAAQAFRVELKTRIARYSIRRRFWERFVDTVFRADGPPPDGALAHLADEAATDTRRAGEIVLVGAGPGDPELLTLKAVRALQAADVILYDHLVSDGVLDLARREARRMAVGKRARGPSCRQDEINETMIALAKKGRRVVRLKGGDPSVFGRAGEEIAAARAAGIRVSVIPGVTAALAAAAALDLSLTHRDHARRLQFVTGHARSGALPDDLDFARIADRDATTALYMGRATAEAFVARALAAGLAADTPVASVANATRPDQHVATGHLADLTHLVGEAEDSAPVIVLVGRVLETLQRAEPAELAATAQQA